MVLFIAVYGGVDCVLWGYWLACGLCVIGGWVGDGGLRVFRFLILCMDVASLRVFHLLSVAWYTVLAC